ncbi:hypothetical protein EDI29_06930 [Pectobacterium polonicum]|nr:hypothetical protein EDI29_06930 [Pectobacterium polonicum]
MSVTIIRLATKQEKDSQTSLLAYVARIWGSKGSLAGVSPPQFERDVRDDGVQKPLNADRQKG